MNGIERGQMEMLTRVRNFGEANRSVFEKSPGALQTFAEVGALVAELNAVDVKKMRVSETARAARRTAARDALRQMLQDVAQLADHRRKEGQAIPVLDLPTSKSDVAMLTAGRKFAEDVVPFDADFSNHGLGSSHIGRATAALDAAVNDQGMSRADHVGARTRIRELIAAGLRTAKRLDLILVHDLTPTPDLADQWAQLRRIEYPARSRKDDTTDAPVADAPPTAPIVAPGSSVVEADLQAGQPRVEAGLQAGQTKEADHAAGA